MKLILTADVDNLGAVGDTVEVKDGYGRNFLLPRGMAIVASRGAQRQADEIRRARETKTVRDREHATEIKSAIEALGPVSLPVKTASDSGKLFGSVTAGDVVAAIKKAGGPNLDKRIIPNKALIAGAVICLAIAIPTDPGGVRLVDAGRRYFRLDPGSFQRRQDFFRTEVVRFRDLVNPLLCH